MHVHVVFLYIVFIFLYWFLYFLYLIISSVFLEGELKMSQLVKKV